MNCAIHMQDCELEVSRFEAAVQPGQRAKVHGTASLGSAPGPQGPLPTRSCVKQRVMVWKPSAAGAELGEWRVVLLSQRLMKLLGFAVVSGWVDVDALS